MSRHTLLLLSVFALCASSAAAQGSDSVSVRADSAAPAMNAPVAQAPVSLAVPAVATGIRAALIANARADVPSPVTLHPSPEGAPAPAPAPAPRAGQASAEKLMIFGGAAILVGAVVGGNGGGIIMIGGAVVGLYGLWKYLD